MSRHHDSARSCWGWSVFDVPVKRVMASLVTDWRPTTVLAASNTGMLLKRTRATVWTRPVGLFVHW